MADLLRLSTGSPGVSGKGKAQSKGRKKKRKNGQSGMNLLGLPPPRKRGEKNVMVTSGTLLLGDI